MSVYLPVGPEASFIGNCQVDIILPVTHNVKILASILSQEQAGLEALAFELPRTSAVRSFEFQISAQARIPSHVFDVLGYFCIRVFIAAQNIPLEVLQQVETRTVAFRR